MTKNRLLNIAIIICNFLRIVYILMFIGLTIFFVHLQVDRDAYRNFDYKNAGAVSGVGISTKSSWKISEPGKEPLSDKEVFRLDKINTVSLYILYSKCSALLLLVFLCIKEFHKVLTSVKTIDTFKKSNVITFRRIGKYLFLFFLIGSYWRITFEQGGIAGVYITFTPLLLMLVAFIMAEIFKEGNKLDEENRLTV